MIPSFRLAFRNLKRDKSYTLISVIGLTVGFTACALIAVLIHYECSYDAQFSKADRTYRVIETTVAPNGDELVFSTVPAGVGDALVEEITGIEEKCRVFNLFGERETPIRTDDPERGTFIETNPLYVDSDFFSVFDFEKENAHLDSSFITMEWLVLTESTAYKFFGDEDPIGRMIYSENDPMMVRGVTNDIQGPTHFVDFPYVCVCDTWMANFPQWEISAITTYIVLAEGYTPEMLREELDAVVERHLGERLSANNMTYRLDLEPLRDIHLYSPYTNRWFSTVSFPVQAIRNVQMFGFIGGVILLLLFTNYASLATSRCLKNVRQIGIQKIVGASRKTILSNYIIESLLLFTIATALAYGLMTVLLPHFANIVSKPLDLCFETSAWFIGGMFLISLVVGTATGVLPALMLSTQHPVQMVKGQLLAQQGRGKIRSGLVVLQFSALITLILCSLVVWQQLQYIHNKPLGLNVENTITIPIPWAWDDIQAESMRSRYEQIASVESVSGTDHLPFRPSRDLQVTCNQSASEDKSMMRIFNVDASFLETMQMELVEGRFLDRELRSDFDKIILNETAVRHFGLENPIGAEIAFYSMDEDVTTPTRTREVIGVVRDFHYEPLRESIGPMGMEQFISEPIYLTVRFDHDITAADVQLLQDIWEKDITDFPFSTFFLEEYMRSLYNEEDRIARTFTMCALIALIIALLGVLSLAMYTTERRTKEIGIRKVLGATSLQVIGLLNKQLLWIVLAAFLIGTPIASLLMQRWLENFSYHTVLPWWLFPLAGLFVLLFAVGTVSSHAWRTVNMNPVNTLRQE